MMLAIQPPVAATPPSGPACLVLCLLVLLIHILQGLLVHVQHHTVDGHFPGHWLRIFAVIGSLLNYVATPVSHAVGIWTCFTCRCFPHGWHPGLSHHPAGSAVGLQNCSVATTGSAVNLLNCADTFRAVGPLYCIDLDSCNVDLRVIPLNCVGTVSGVSVPFVDILFWIVS